MTRPVDALMLAEWEALIQDFADLLAKHDVAGSVAARYSLYIALEDERRHAIELSTRDEVRET